MSNQKEAVILLHGLAAHRLLLTRIERSLRSVGFQTTNWGYRSIWNRVEYFSDRLLPVIRACNEDASIDRIHFVAHSMGSIIVRRALVEERPTKLGRIVMLAPPNRGSHVASRLVGPLGRICPPLRDLTDRHDSLVNQLPIEEGLEVGVIAARSDIVVRPDSTRLPYLKDWMMLPGHHSGLLFRAETPRLIASFLREGQFTEKQQLCVAD